MMDRWVGKVAIVTGASSGIGRAIASRFVEEGVKVVAVARRKDRLESLANTLAGKKGQLHPYVADIGKTDDLIKAFEWTNKNIGLVHILVNNAGVGILAPLVDFKFEDFKAALDVNVVALTVATREALKTFKENNIKGHIININSIAGHWVTDIPGIGLYTGSKYAVTALTESTSLEMKGMKLGAKATSISPGLVETEIAGEEMWDNWKKNPEYSAMRTEDIADATIYVLSTPPNCEIAELTIRPIFVPKSG